MAFIDHRQNTPIAHQYFAATGALRNHICAVQRKERDEIVACEQVGKTLFCVRLLTRMGCLE